MPELTLELPDFLTADEARLMIAIQLFQEERVSCGRAAEIAGLAKDVFIDELGRRRIPVFNSPADDVATDMQNA